MEYKAFLDFLHEIAKPYSHIKIPKYIGSDESSVARIPNAFISLLDCVLSIVHNNISEFCNPLNQNMVLFGLQPAAGMYTTEDNDVHFCCTLDYYLVSKNTEINKGSHLNTLTLVIDFTTGAMLSDTDYCASFASKTRPTTPTYGTIPSDRLQQAWSEINNNQNLLDAASREIKESYLPTYLKYLKNSPEPSLTMPYLAAVLIFNQPPLKTDIRHEAPSDASKAKLHKRNALTSSGDQDISHTRQSSLSSSL